MTRIAELAVVVPFVIGACQPYEAKPVLALDAGCPVSLMVALGKTAPDYGFGTGPVYLSGQTDWYSGGQSAIVMVDSVYAGPLLVHAVQLGGVKSGITLVDESLPPDSLASVAAKERDHSVVVVAAIPTTDGAIQLQAAEPSSLWRAWFGRLSTDGPGCYGLQADGTAFSETIVFSVHGGPAPPG